MSTHRKRRARWREPADVVTQSSQSVETGAGATSPEPLDLIKEFSAEERTPLPFELEDDPTINATLLRTPSSAVPRVQVALEKAPNAAVEAAEDIDDSETNIEILYDGAKTAARNGRLGLAARLYDRLLKLDPTNVTARNDLALAYDGSGDHESALKELDNCIELEPENPMLLLNRAAIAGALGRYLDAEDDLKTVLENDPSNSEAHYNLGLVFSRKGLWSEAIPELRKAIELDESRATAYYYLGEALNHMDDLQGALQAFQRAVELGPNHRNALYGMGIMLDRLNKPEEAAEMYRRSREVEA